MKARFGIPLAKLCVSSYLSTSKTLKIRLFKNIKFKELSNIGNPFEHSNYPPASEANLTERKNPHTPF